MEKEHKSQTEKIKKILEEGTGHKAVCLVSKEINGSLYTEWAITSEQEVKALVSIGNSGIYDIKYMDTWVAGCYKEIDALLIALTH